MINLDGYTKEDMLLPEEIEISCPSCTRLITQCDNRGCRYEFTIGDSVVCVGNKEHICEDCYRSLPDEVKEE